MKSKTGAMVIGVLCVLACATSPTNACPADQPCVTVIAGRRMLPNLAPAPFPVGIVSWQANPTSPSPAAETDHELALWSVLQRHVHGRLPHTAKGGLAIEASPTIVTGAFDTVPGVGVDGRF